MSNPFTELNRVQGLMEKTIPCHALLSKDYFSEFIYIAATSPYPFMLQDMWQTKPAYFSPSIYTFMGYEQDDENLPMFETLLHQSGCLKRYGEYCDHFKVRSSDEFSTTLPLKTKGDTIEHVLMFSRALPFFNASGYMVLSVFRAVNAEHDPTSPLSLPGKKEKQFMEGFKLLDERDKKIVKHVAGGKTYEETGDIVFLSGPGVKARMSGILDKLGINRDELKICYNELKKFRNRV